MPLILGLTILFKFFSVLYLSRIRNKKALNNYFKDKVVQHNLITPQVVEFRYLKSAQPTVVSIRVLQQVNKKNILQTAFGKK